MRSEVKVLNQQLRNTKGKKEEDSQKIAARIKGSKLVYGSTYFNGSKFKMTRFKRQGSKERVYIQWKVYMFALHNVFTTECWHWHLTSSLEQKVIKDVIATMTSRLMHCYAWSCYDSMASWWSPDSSSWNMNSCWYSFKNCVDLPSSKNKEYTRLMSSTSTSVPCSEKNSNSATKFTVTY